MATFTLPEEMLTTRIDAMTVRRDAKDTEGCIALPNPEPKPFRYFPLAECRAMQALFPVAAEVLFKILGSRQG